MKLYFATIDRYKGVFMSNYQNEKIEWSRVWRESADTNQKRILLIGDSIIDGCKGNIYSCISKKGYASTAYVTSKGINNPYYLKELKLVIEQEDYNYECVYIQYGGHSGGQTRKECKANYVSLLKSLKKLLPDIPIILATVTPITNGDGSENEHDTPISFKTMFHERNKRKIELNEDVREIANKMHLELFDTYQIMADKPELKLSDGIHFKPQGNVLLGTAIAEKILSILR